MDEVRSKGSSIGGRNVTRRDLLRYGAGSASMLALPGLLAACGSDSGGGAATSGGASGSVTFAGNGGALQEAQTKAFFDPFMKENPGIKVVQDVGSTDYARFEAMVKAGNVTWDILDVGGDFGDAPEQQAMLAPLDCDQIACTDKDGGNRFRVPVHKYAAVMGFRTDKGPGPRTWAEWFDLDKFPGKRAIFKVPTGTGLYECALLADGVPIDKLYPLDVDRAFKKFETIRDSIVWAASPTDTVRLLADGEVALANVFSSQAYAISQDGGKVGVVWNEYGLGTDYLVVPKAAKNKAAAMKLVAYMTSPEHNAQLPNIYPVAPGNPAAAVDRSSPTYPFLPNDKGGTHFEFDSAYYSANLTPLTRAFERWLQG